MADASPAAVLSVAGRKVPISNPDKLLFPQPKHTKLDLARYYVAVADGALRGAGGRPNMLVRYPNGVEGDHFYQKRAPPSRPRWIEVATIRFPSGRSAEESCRAMPPRSRGLPISLAWSCIRIPCERRISTIPMSCASISIRCPGVTWKQVQQVPRRSFAAFCRTTSSWAGPRHPVRAACTSACASSSAGRSMRCAARHSRCAREVERRAPKLATSKWWKEERHGVFVDYNQNAKDRTVASAYSVRPTPDARVSAPLTWDEVDRLRTAGFHPRLDALALPQARGPARRHRPRTGRVDRELARAVRAPGRGRRAVAAVLSHLGSRRGLQGPRDRAEKIFSSSYGFVTSSWS